MSDQFWKPSKEVQRAVRRGDKKVKEAQKRIAEQAERERLEKLYQGWK